MCHLCKENGTMEPWRTKRAAVHSLFAQIIPQIDVVDIKQSYKILK